MAVIQVSTTALSQGRAIFLFSGVVVLFRAFVKDRHAPVTILDTNFAGLDAQKIVFVCCIVLLYLIISRYIQSRVDQLDADAATSTTAATDTIGTDLLRRAMAEWAVVTAFSFWAPLVVGAFALAVGLSYLAPPRTWGFP